MKKKKIIVLGMIFIMLFCLVACNSKTESYDELEEKVKQTYIDTYLKDKLNAKIDKDVWIKNFLGIYNGNFVTVYGVNNGVDGLTEKYEFDNITFSWGSSFPIVVWHDNKIYQLKEAYEQKFITYKNLNTIASLYHDSVYDDKMEQLQEDYLQQFGCDFNFDPIRDLSYGIKYRETRYYGTYNNALVIFTAQDGTDKKTTKISDLEFNYDTDFTLLVWHGGTFYNLEKDIDLILKKGLLDKEDIKTINSVHCSYNKYVDMMDYKAKKTYQIDSIVENKGEVNFSQECWQGICTYADKAKSTIKDAHGKAIIDDEVKLFTEVINNVPTKDKGIEDGFKKAYVNSSYYPGAPTDFITFFEYLGTYNDSHVALISDKEQYDDSYHFVQVANCLFYIPQDSKIFVLHSGLIYNLEEAYFLQLITSENLNSIKKFI